MAMKDDVQFNDVLEVLKVYFFAPTYIDRRTENLFLVNAKQAIGVVIFYFVSIKLLKMYMADRKPYTLKTVSFIHNAFLVLLSTYMCIETFMANKACQEKSFLGSVWLPQIKVGAPFTPSCQRLVAILHIHYLSKVYEFIDTWIMILKKNDRQVTFLHTYHHATTFLCWYAGLVLYPGGSIYIVCALNSFVHIFMYLYYLVASTKLVKIPQFYKKAITQMQIIQFTLYIVQAIIIGFKYPNFRPRGCILLAIAQSSIFFILFYNFFKNSYKKLQKNAKKE